jgi:hypothetical protein
MSFREIQSALTTYRVHPSARDVASTAGNGATAKEVEFAALVDAVMNGGDWVVSGFDYVSATGLTATFNAGIAILAGRRVYSTGTFTVTLTGSATNHVWLTFTQNGSGQATALGCEVNTTGTPPSTPYLYLRTLITNVTTVTGGADQRSTNPPYASLSGGFLVHEQGGLETNVGALADGVVKITGGATSIATPGTDYYKPGGADVALADGGTGVGTDALARAALGAAPTDATYITTDGHADLSAEQNVSALSNGILKHSAGVLAQAGAGTDYYNPGGTDVALADGGTGASLTDPNADRIFFWDDSAGQVTWLQTPGVGLTISGTSISLSAMSGPITVQLFPMSNSLANDEVSATDVYKTVSINAVNVAYNCEGYFVVPTGVTTPTAAYLVASSGSTTEGDIRITVQCSTQGEAVNGGGSVNTTTTSTWYPHGTANWQESIDISGLFTGIAAGDLVCIAVELNSGTVLTYPLMVHIEY